MRNDGNVSGSTFFHTCKATRVSLSAHGKVIPDEIKILISGDNFDTNFLFKTIFELWGFQAFLSDGLEHTISIIEKFKPNLILLDSILPFADHLENIRQIRRHKISKRLPIIVISGFSQPLFKDLSMAAGANDFLVKPLDFDLLENHIKMFIETPLTTQLK